LRRNLEGASLSLNFPWSLSTIIQTHQKIPSKICRDEAEEIIEAAAAKKIADET
jgi:hypothetical protein